MGQDCYPLRSSVHLTHFLQNEIKIACYFIDAMIIYSLKNYKRNDFR